MKLHFLLAGGVAMGLLVSAPDLMAHGGGGGGGGNSFHGGGGGNSFHAGGGWHGGGWHGGGWRGAGWHGRGRYWYRGRFFGPAIGFYGYWYPWWGWDYPYYPAAYYGYDPYYNGSYEGHSGSYDGDNDPRLTSTRAVQAALAWRGYYSGRVDGVMGPETRDAIRSFQTREGLPVTGRIDSRLIDALRR